MNPQTMDGMAARNSIKTFRTSRVRVVQNSDTKIAAAKPTGTAMIIARSVTDAVPARRARMPNCGRIVDSGRQLTLVKNSSLRSSVWKRAEAPSRKTKTKIANTKMIALQPHSPMSSSMIVSVNAPSRRLISGRMLTGGPARIGTSHPSGQG